MISEQVCTVVQVYEVPVFVRFPTCQNSRAPHDEGTAYVPFDVAPSKIQL